ncbi:MAG TPA: NAD-dependent epimerase/dehydratase family protein, partial [Anaerolineae bacterium]
MPVGRVVMVTGAAGAWGGRVAGALAATPGLQVLGIDARPRESIAPGQDFVRADVRNPLLAELLQDERVDTVVHLAFQESDRPDEQAFEANVTGTARLLGACAAAGVRLAVIASSTLAYGARPDNSAFLSEEHGLNGSQSWGTARDLAAREAACRAFAASAPGPRLAVLRFAHLVGPGADSPLGRFLAEPWAPALLGFDPMMQVLDEEDAAAALVHAVVNEAAGPYNIAAEGSLPLSQVMA